MIFNLYPESAATMGYWVRAANALMYFMLVFSALQLYRLAHYHRTQVVLTGEAVFWTSVSALVLNLAGYNLNWLAFTVVYLFVAWASWKWIPRKSLRWTNIATALFFLFTLLSYNLFNTKMQGITYPFFATNDVIEYRFDYKPYFAIPWLAGDTLASVKFWIDGVKHEMTNEPAMVRIYLFYYTMHSFALIFWMLIFTDVLKKHAFFYDKVSSKHHKTMLYTAPAPLTLGQLLRAVKSFFARGVADERAPAATDEAR